MLISNKTSLKERRKELRKKSTPAESVLWMYLRGGALGQKVYRQFSIDNYIADFCFPRARLVIEIDGGIHEEETQKEYDEIRTTTLRAYNYKVLRFTNQQVLNNPDVVIDQIKSFLTSSRRPLFAKEGDGGR